MLFLLLPFERREGKCFPSRRGNFPSLRSKGNIKGDLFLREGIIFLREGKLFLREGKRKGNFSFAKESGREIFPSRRNDFPSPSLREGKHFPSGFSFGEGNVSLLLREGKRFPSGASFGGSHRSAYPLEGQEDEGMHYLQDFPSAEGIIFLHGFPSAEGVISLRDFPSAEGIIFLHDFPSVEGMIPLRDFPSAKE